MIMELVGRTMEDVKRVAGKLQTKYPKISQIAATKLFNRVKLDGDFECCEAIRNELRLEGQKEKISQQIKEVESVADPIEEVEEVENES